MRSPVPKPRSLSLTSGRPGSSSLVGLPISAFFAAAALEHAQHVARLRDFPARQRLEERQPALRSASLPPSAPGTPAAAAACRRARSSRRSARSCRVAAVVVERRLPQHRAGRHHAGADVADFGRMAAAAGLVGDAQIAGVDELDVFRRFLEPLRVGALGIRGRSSRDPDTAAAGAPSSSRSYVRRHPRRARGRPRSRVAAVAVAQPSVHGPGRMHRRFVGLGVAGDASRALARLSASPAVCSAIGSREASAA